MANELERLRTALAERYRIERELGRGGMATVYLAEDLKHHRQVAVKVLDPHLAAGLGPARFLRAGPSPAARWGSSTLTATWRWCFRSSAR